MKRSKSSQPSLGDVAKAAKVSQTAVSYALRNREGVSKKTRARILRIAKHLGYVPDARIASWMLRMREAKSKDLLPLAWLNSRLGKEAKSHSSYFEGARARALEMGYQLESIWTRQTGMTMQRVSQIIFQRGIEGVIISQPARHVRLDWTRLAGISIDGALLVPNLNRVMSDYAFNLLLALKELKRLGYRRIGLCLPESVDRYSYHYHTCRSTALYFQSEAEKVERVSPLFYRNPIKDVIKTWVRQHEPQVVIGLDASLLTWITEMGLRVPEDIGIVHLGLEDKVGDWAGINPNQREIGTIAAEQVISSIQNQRFGIPKLATTTLIRGSWRLGRTLASPLE